MFSLLREKMLHADVLVFATPIYYYEMSGILKTMLDRANPLYSSDYQFREIYCGESLVAKQIRN